MSQVSAGILGVLAVAFSLGAAQLASGGDVAIGNGNTASVANRVLKSDRGDVHSPRTEGRTFSIRLENLPDTSILIRMPASHQLEARDHIIKRGKENQPQRKVRRTIGCEAVVSVLTDIATRLQPGRCVA